MKSAAWAALICALATSPIGAQQAMAPRFDLRLADGTSIASEKLAGKIVVLNLWATWCVPCRHELEEMEAFADSHPNGGVAIFAINMDRGLGPDRMARATAAIRLPIATAITGGEYHPIRSAIPTTYLIDRRGHLVGARAGAFPQGEFSRIVTKLMADPPPP